MRLAVAQGCGSGQPFIQLDSAHALHILDTLAWSGLLACNVGFLADVRRTPSSGSSTASSTEHILRSGAPP
jgi:hypothetical protein